MLTLMKRERALRWLPVACLAAALAAVWIFATISVLELTSVPALQTEGSGEPLRLGGGRAVDLDVSLVYMLLMFVTVQVSVVVSLRHLSLQTRILDFERSLPLSARAVILQRAATAWLIVALPFLTASAVLALKLTEPSQFAALGAVVLQGLFRVTLGLLVFFVYRPRLHRLHTVEVVGASIIAICIVLAPGMFGPESLDAVTVALVVLCAAFLWLRLGHWSAAEDPRIASPGSVAAAAPMPVRILGPLRWTLLRSTFLRPIVLFLAVMTLAFLAAVGTEALIFMLWFPVLLVHNSVRFGLNLLQGIDSLPIPRERLLRFLVLPSLAVLLIGSTILAAQPRPFAGHDMLSRRIQIDGQREETLDGRSLYTRHVLVPPTLWQLATIGDGTRVVAPWGETTEPTPHPLFWGAATFAYNPYDVGPTNSGRFLMWQLTRALREMHGYDGTPDELHERWFSTVDRTKTVEDLRFRTVDSPDWGLGTSQSGRVPNTLGFGALLATLAWFSVAAFCLRPNTPARSGARWRRVLSGEILGTAFVLIVVFLFIKIDSSDSAIMPVMMTRLHMSLDAALRSSPVLWTILVGAVAGASYSFLAWCMRRIEVPPLVVNGWNKKAFPIY